MKLYNTITHSIEDFIPIDSDNIRMYVCGPTVYDRPHVGNARPAVVFDVLYRTLQKLYPRVTYVSNITDIDDKIIQAAKDKSVDIGTITTRAFLQYQNDMQALNVLPPTHQPKATEYVEQMKDIISKLVEKGHAYEKEGDVLFRISSFEGYGKFARPENESDFALWKNVDNEEEGLNKGYCWSSPGEEGFGRPGWHIECTAMSTALLGSMFDIHGGGMDLSFPHHENERAQTCCYSGLQDCANYWMHNGLIQFEQGKMSKSLGNIIFLGDVSESTSALSVRLFLLQTHYRHSLHWSQEGLELAHKRLTKFYKRLSDYQIELLSHRSDQAPSRPVSEGAEDQSSIMNALQQDLNTPLAITIIEQYLSDNQLDKAYEGLDLLGLIPLSIRDWLQRRPLTQEQQTMLDQRVACRQNKRFADADELRRILLDQGIVVEDKPNGYDWYVL